METTPEALLKNNEQTRLHVQRVQHYLIEFAHDLLRRALKHDDSKFSVDEAPYFAASVEKLKNSTYNSEEYKQTLLDIQPALQHHYKCNSHHPEHYSNGIAGMDLLDIVELFCDWKAASERHANGSIEQSIINNQVRFDLQEQIVSIMNNTVPWIKKTGDIA
jgi:hypothetical protein